MPRVVLVAVLLFAGCNAPQAETVPVLAALPLAPILAEGGALRDTRTTHYRCDGVGGGTSELEMVWLRTVERGGTLGFQDVAWESHLGHMAQEVHTSGVTNRFDTREVFASDPLYAAVGPAVGSAYRVTVSADGVVAVAGLESIRAQVAAAPDHPIRRSILAAHADEAAIARVAVLVRPFGARRTAAVGETWQDVGTVAIWGAPVEVPLSFVAGYENARGVVRWAGAVDEVALPDGTVLRDVSVEGVWGIAHDATRPSREETVSWSAQTARGGSLRCWQRDALVTGPA